MCCIDSFSLKRLGYKKIEGMQENPKGLPANTRQGCTRLLMPTLHQQRCKVAICRDVQPLPCVGRQSTLALHWSSAQPIIAGDTNCSEAQQRQQLESPPCNVNRSQIDWGTKQSWAWLQQDLSKRVSSIDATGVDTDASLSCQCKV